MISTAHMILVVSSVSLFWATLICAVMIVLEENKAEDAVSKEDRRRHQRREGRYYLGAGLSFIAGMLLLLLAGM